MGNRLFIASAIFLGIVAPIVILSILLWVS